MPILRINAQNEVPQLHGVSHALGPVLHRALGQDGPIVVMVHGYRFLPGDGGNCPHRHIFAPDTTTNHRGLSWPRHLGFGRGHLQDGLAIAFGWNARGSLWRARKTASEAARALAYLVRMIRKIDTTRPVHVIAHSLGGYLALEAMQHLWAGDLGRVILMNAAAYQSQAKAALRTPAGRECELFNVISRENNLYDLMFERIFRPNVRCDRALGRGISARNAVTLDLGNRVILARMRDIGFPVAAPAHWACHWSTYLRPGIFPFYQSLLRAPARLPFSYLQHILRADIPNGVTAATTPLLMRVKRAS